MDYSKNYVKEEIPAEFINVYTTKGLLQITIYIMNIMVIMATMYFLIF